MNQESVSAERPLEPLPMSRRLVAARIIALMKLLYVSAGPAYRSATQLSDLEWRVLMLVGDRGPMVLTGLSTLLHLDKGQVSHAVKALRAQDILARAHLRAPITLTRTGQSMFGRILEIGRRRNAALVRALSDAERRMLPALLAALQEGAHSLVIEEQGLTHAPAVPPANRRLTGPQRLLIAQDLFGLQNLLQRSAALAYRRAAQLSDFEWRVLTQIGEHAPLMSIELVPLLSRDKGQVGRTLTRLESRGLVTRERIGGGRHIRLDLTDRGSKVYERLAELALERNDKLLTQLSVRKQKCLHVVLDKLTAAAGLLARQSV